jgi:N-succinyl-L-ornithine transcarbamylase
MKNFCSVSDTEDPAKAVWESIQIKENPFYNNLLRGKTLGLIFFNSSLRTRLSTQKAAFNLGMNTVVINLNQDSWQLEFEDGVCMNASSPEHIKEAAAMLSLYCDVVGVRCFATFENQEKDKSDFVLNSFKKHLTIPLFSMESATLHPLQSLADMMCIFERKKKHIPKIALCWAPHVKVLPQAVPNSFAEWCNAMQYDLHIAQPEGFELEKKYSQNAKIHYDLESAVKDADFIYIKNWSSTKHYGKFVSPNKDWLLNTVQYSLSNSAYIMHCLPARRNLEIKDEIIDHPNSIVVQQAENRIYAAQYVLQNLFKSEQKSNERKLLIENEWKNYM